MRIWIAEAGNAPPPVGVISIRCSFLTGNLFSPIDQTWTRSTIAHCFANGFQRFHGAMVLVNEISEELEEPTKGICTRRSGGYR